MRLTSNGETMLFWYLEPGSKWWSSGYVSAARLKSWKILKALLERHAMLQDATPMECQIKLFGSSDAQLLPQLHDLHPLHWR